MSMLAVVLVGAAVLLTPSRSDRALSYLEDGDPETALSMALAALELEPGNERAARIVADIQTHMGLMDEAELTLRQRIEIHGRTPSALQDLARHYHATGQRQKAVELYLVLPPAALSSDEKSYIARWLRQTGDVDGELAFVARLWSDGENEEAFGRRYAELLAVRGQTNEALSVFRALDENGALRSSTSRMQFLAVLLLSGDKEEAVERASDWLSEPEQQELASAILQFDKSLVLEAQFD